MDHRRDQEAVGVGKDVALAPVHLLAGVIPARATGLDGLDRLAVDDPGRGLAPACLAHSHHQRVVDRCHSAASRQR